MRAPNILATWTDKAAATALVCIPLGAVLAPVGVGIPLMAYGVVAAFVALCFGALARWIGGVA